jgi:uncharacterized membrane protein YccC
MTDTVSSTPVPSAAPPPAAAASTHQLNSPTRQAMITALSCYLATLMSLTAGMENPWWPTLTALLVSNPDARMFWTRGILRILGTVAGCIIGYNLAVQCEDSMLAQIVALFMLSSSSIYGSLRSRYPYAWFLYGLTSLLIMLNSLSGDTDLYSYAWFRAMEIAMGVVAVAIVEALLARRPVGLPSLAHLVATPPASKPMEAIPFALAVGIVTVLIPLLWKWFELPALVPAATLGMFVFDRNLRTLRRQGLEGILGCLIGGLAGLAVLTVNADLFVWWSFALIAGLFLLGRIQQSGGPYVFVGIFGGLTYLMTLITGNGPPQNIETPFSLLCGILIATAVMYAVLYLVVPPALHTTIARRIAAPEHRAIR